METQVKVRELKTCPEYSADVLGHVAGKTGKGTLRGEEGLATLLCKSMRACVLRIFG
jgi:hypothetical protein